MAYDISKIVKLGQSDTALIETKNKIYIQRGSSMLAEAGGYSLYDSRVFVFGETYVSTPTVIATLRCANATSGALSAFDSIEGNDSLIVAGVDRSSFRLIWKFAGTKEVELNFYIDWIAIGDIEA